MRIGAHSYTVNVSFGADFPACEIEDTGSRGFSSWLLTCTSTGHGISVDALAAFLRHVVSPSLPSRFSHFSRDTDSIGDFVLGWDDPHDRALSIFAWVLGGTGTTGGSYYQLSIEHKQK
jgi:hypothetical protein